MSNEKKEDLTPVVRMEKKAMMPQRKEISETLDNRADKPKKEEEQKGVTRGDKAISELINDAAGSPFVTPVFGEMAFRQLANIILEDKDIVRLGDKNKEPVEKLIELIPKFTLLLKGIAPKDQIEGMLAIQMIGTHYATMKALSRANTVNNIELSTACLNSASKLARTYTMQMEALNRHRGKGQQKMTVEHVHVHSGGQAIVGSVSSAKDNQGGGK